MVGPPLWKIWKSVGTIIPNIWENRIDVPNHHPAYRFTRIQPTPLRVGAAAPTVGLIFSFSLGKTPWTWYQLGYITLKKHSTLECLFWIKVHFWNPIKNHLKFPVNPLKDPMKSAFVTMKSAFVTMNSPFFWSSLWRSGKSSQGIGPEIPSWQALGERLQGFWARTFVQMNHGMNCIISGWWLRPLKKIC